MNEELKLGDVLVACVTPTGTKWAWKGSRAEIVEINETRTIFGLRYVDTGHEVGWIEPLVPDALGRFWVKEV